MERRRDGGRDSGMERRRDGSREPARSAATPRPMGEMSEEEAAMASEVRVFLFGVGRDKLEGAMVESGVPGTDSQ